MKVGLHYIPAAHNNTNDHNVNDSDDDCQGHLTKNPPPTCVENFRDHVLRILDNAFFQRLGILVLVAVIVDGAVFFFFLMGWQNLCRPRTDCNPRNDIYNVSVQILNVLFTYMAMVSLPWRWTNFVHATGWHCPRRRNEPGFDLYGMPTMDIWFHLSPKHRIVILVFLILTCLFQFVNQSQRIVYYSYELQSEYPGTLWVNLFFASSFLCAFTGATLLVYFSHLKRKEHPGKFGPGPKQLVQGYWDTYIRREKQGNSMDGKTEEICSNDSKEDQASRK